MQFSFQNIHLFHIYRLYIAKRARFDRYYFFDEFVNYNVNEV